MKALAVHFSFEFLAGLRNRTMLLMLYLFPLAFYFGVGQMMIVTNPFFSPQLIPTMVTFAILSGTILGLPNVLVDARTAGILRSYRINGLTAGPLLIVPSLSTSIHLIIVFTIIFISAPLIFSVTGINNLVHFVLVFLLALFAHSGLGVLIGVIASNSRSTILWSQLIYLPSLLLGGMMVPVSALPDAYATVGRLFPATYAMQGFLGFEQTGEALYNPAWSLLILLTGGILAYFLAYYLFCWDQNEKRRRHPVLAILALAPYLLGMLFLGAN